MRSVLAEAVFSVYRALPPAARFKLKNLVKANGHAVSSVDWLKGMRDAAGKKRLDRSLRTVIEVMKYAGIPSLENSRCMEVGAGFVPSDSLAFYLLGANFVVMTDYNRIVQFDAMKSAVESAAFEEMEEMIAPFVSTALFRTRLESLKAALEQEEKGLRSLNIQYKAPLDLSARPMDERFDLIYSISVFEHIVPAQIPIILQNLVHSLSPSGVLLNDIHLEDHFDMHRDPFKFLRADDDFVAERDADMRGNRIRFSGWQMIFSGLSHSDTRILSRTIREDCRPASSELATEFCTLDPSDCFTARILAESRLSR